MKKFIISIIIAILAFTSCGTMDRADFKYTITYTFDGSMTSTYTDVVDSHPSSPPYYVMSPNGTDTYLRILIGVGYPYTVATIYKGPLNVKVNDFTVTPIRQYKVSRFSGKEIK